MIIINDNDKFIREIGGCNGFVFVWGVGAIDEE